MCDTEESPQYYRITIGIHRADALPSCDSCLAMKVDNQDIGKFNTNFTDQNSSNGRKFSRKGLQLNEQSNLKFTVYGTDQKKDPLGEINLPLYPLYRDENSAVDFVKTIELTGGIIAVVYFSIFIEKLVPPSIFSLTIAISRAENLPIADFFPTMSSDPFIVVTLNGITVAETKTHHRNINPIFDQTFEMHIQSLEQSVLVLKVYDWNQFLAHKILGVVTVPIPTSAEINNVINFTKPLEQAIEGRITARGSITYSLLLKRHDETAPQKAWKCMD